MYFGNDASLFAELVAQFGDDSVRATDNSGAETFTGWYPVAVKYRQAEQDTHRLLATVSPENTAALGRLLRWATQHQVALMPVGGGSNTVGSTVAKDERATIAVHLARFDSVEWDETGLSVTAGAGVVLADLEETLNKHQYTLGSLPQSARIATVGGAVATESFGLFAAGYGGVRENTIALEALLPNGEVVRTTANGAATRVLHHLLIGTEGAFGTITAATLAIRPMPEVRAWCGFTFARFADAADALRLIYRSDARPACVRLFDADAARERWAGEISPGSSLLLLGVEGSEVVQTGQYQTVFAVCKQVGGSEAAIDGDAWYESDRFRTDAFAPNGRSGSLADVLSVFAPWSSLVAAYSALTEGLRPDVATLSAQIGYATPHGVAIDFRFVAETASPHDAIARYERILQNAQIIGLTHGVQVAHHYSIGVARATWANAERGSAPTQWLSRLIAASSENE